MTEFPRRTRRSAALIAAVAMTLLAACESTPTVPYPAFIQADELPDVFLASFPGIRAKQFAGNSQTRRSSNRLLLPAQWNGTTGAALSKSLELYVIDGDLTHGDLSMSAGGYAWFPAGWSGSNLSTEGGATLLYFLNDANPAHTIRSPYITTAEIVGWEPVSDKPRDRGLWIKELRADPGSGARTWLLKVEPAAVVPWQRRPRLLEGYLLSGRYRDSECIAGTPVNGEYLPGGYFFRPAWSINGGPVARALETSVWFLRMKGEGDAEFFDRCSSGDNG